MIRDTFRIFQLDGASTNDWNKMAVCVFDAVRPSEKMSLQRYD